MEHIFQGIWWSKSPKALVTVIAVRLDAVRVDAVMVDALRNWMWTLFVLVCVPDIQEGSQTCQ